MRVTGWTYPELRAAPARVVRMHMARIFAGMIWSPKLAEAAREAVPPRSAFATLGDYANARAAKGNAMSALTTLERFLWPEDE